MVKLTAILNWNGFHNIPKKYIKRAMFNGVVYENTHYITPTVVYDYNKDWIFDEHAPWTQMAKLANIKRSKPKEPLIVPPLREWFFYRGDKVQIMTGKDAGRQGTISAIIKQRNWVFVKDLNMKLIAYMLSEDSNIREYKQKEKPLVVNRDVKLLDPSDLQEKPCDVVFRYIETGEKVRVSKRTGHVLPVPPEHEATADYAKRSLYKPGDKDTQPEILKLKTFEPKYKSFEQELSEEYGLPELPKRATTYFY